MVLNAAGIAGGWTVEQMPTPRVMGDAILTPDGKVRRFVWCLAVAVAFDLYSPLSCFAFPIIGTHRQRSADWCRRLR